MSDKPTESDDASKSEKPDETLPESDLDNVSGGISPRVDEPQFISFPPAPPPQFIRAGDDLKLAGFPVPDGSKRAVRDIYARLLAEQAKKGRGGDSAGV